ncbi:MAG: adenosylcobinamide-GDP ribazoletransferase [Leptolyngbya sp. SIO3F4]|nr:adenosylcobinamide-GDP ribazoletransferase [Leptolyngbya sp. SIO3F4]
MERLLKAGVRAANQQWALLNGAVLFYTCLPLPASWPVRFDQIALVVPAVGFGVGSVLVLVDLLLRIELPLLLSSAIVVFLGVWLTGGLHLDGAMDTADGLAVQDDQQRLVAMADSRVGAFGVIAAIAILLLKVTALTAIVHNRWFVLLSAAMWGRWGQQWAIGGYPYIKPDGKGAFHKQAIPSLWYALPWLIGLVAVTILVAVFGWIPWQSGMAAIVVGSGASWLVAEWFARNLGGHTGDTYGAVIEWVEVAVFIGLACVD